MGLYLAMVALWILGATNQRFERPAILSEVFFMSGLAAGRLLSVFVDGWPHWLLVGYIGVEAILAVTGIVLLKQGEAVAEKPSSTPNRVPTNPASTDRLV